MKKLFAAVMAFSIGFCGLCAADEAFDIARKNDECDASTKTVYSAKMTLTNKSGSARVREFSYKLKNFGDTDKSVFVFSKPQDVAGTALLSFSYQAKSDGTKQDDDTWLYMPAMKKVRRISGSGKDEDFMGSDFTYDDIGDRGVYKDDFKLLGEEAVDGVDCYKLEAAAKAANAKYPRHIYWIRKDNFFTQKSETYDKKGALKRVMTVPESSVVDGFFTQTKLLMEDVQTKHSTLIEITNVNHTEDVDDNIFTVATLERGNLR